MTKRKREDVREKSPTQNLKGEVHGQEEGEDQDRTTTRIKYEEESNGILAHEDWPTWLETISSEDSAGVNQEDHSATRSISLRTKYPLGMQATNLHGTELIPDDSDGYQVGICIRDGDFCLPDACRYRRKPPRLVHHKLTLKERVYYRTNYDPRMYREIKSQGELAGEIARVLWSENIITLKGSLVKNLEFLKSLGKYNECIRHIDFQFDDLLLQCFGLSEGVNEVSGKSATVQTLLRNLSTMQRDLRGIVDFIAGNCTLDKLTVSMDMGQEKSNVSKGGAATAHLYVCHGLALQFKPLASLGLNAFKCYLPTLWTLEADFERLVMGDYPHDSDKVMPQDRSPYYPHEESEPLDLGGRTWSGNMIAYPGEQQDESRLHDLLVDWNERDWSVTWAEAEPPFKIRKSNIKREMLEFVLPEGFDAYMAA